IMKRNQLKPQKEKVRDANMKANLKHNILKNKDDLIEGTFCYSLFENAFFDEVLLIDLIKNAKLFFKENNQDKDISNLLTWIVNGVDQCFVSNNDKDDYYSIENYSSDLEIKWKNVWRTEINEIISNSNNC
ncbi:hypothetical protein NPI25_004137, partial [Providencia stuartii]